MKIKEVYILKKAVDDLNEGRVFYNRQAPGIGDYFWDCIIADIDTLSKYAGIHTKKFGVFQMLAKRFPYAYYKVIENTAYVVAILPMPGDPAWMKKKMSGR